MNGENSFEINPGEELRLFNLKQTKRFCIKLITGSAEINGFPLNSEFPLELSFSFESECVAVFSWNGCKISIHSTDNEKLDLGVLASHKTAESNNSDVLEMTKNCIEDDSVSHLLLAGPANSGKSKIAITAMNYAMRMGVNPVLIDLDIASNLLTIPGAIGMALVKGLINPSTNLGQFDPLVTFLGEEHLNNRNMAKYLRCIDHLITTAKQLEKDIRNSPGTEKTLFFVKSKGFEDERDFEILSHLFSSAEIPLINVLVVGLDILVARIRGNDNWKMRVIQLHYSSAIHLTNSAMKRRKRTDHFKRYFYENDGVGKDSLVQKEIRKFGTFTIYTLKEHLLPSTVLPKGEKVRKIQLKPKSISMSHKLAGTVAMICGDDLDAENFDILARGFVLIVSVAEDKKEAELLWCKGFEIGSRKLLASNVKWYDFD